MQLQWWAREEEARVTEERRCYPLCAVSLQSRVTLGGQRRERSGALVIRANHDLRPGHGLELLSLLRHLHFAAF